MKPFIPRQNPHSESEPHINQTLFGTKQPEPHAKPQESLPSSMILQSIQFSPAPTSPPVNFAAASVPTPTPSQTAAESNPSWPVLISPNATTCQPLQISWLIPNSNSTDMTNAFLEITVIGVGFQNNTVGLLNVTGQSIPQGSYTWPVVTVPAGQYVVRGVRVETDGNHLVVQSPLFPVQAGSDTTCLSPSDSQPGNQTQIPGAASPAIGGGSTSHGLNPGEIAGGVIAGLAVLACVGALVIYLYRLHKRRRKSAGVWEDPRSFNFGVARSFNITPGGSKNRFSGGLVCDLASNRVRKGSFILLDEKGTTESTRNSVAPSTPTSTCSKPGFVGTMDLGSTPEDKALRPSTHYRKTGGSPPNSSDGGDPFASPLDTDADNHRSSMPCRPVPAFVPKV